MGLCGPPASLHDWAGQSEPPAPERVRTRAYTQLLHPPTYHMHKAREPCAGTKCKVRAGGFLKMRGLLESIAQRVVRAHGTCAPNVACLHFAGKLINAFTVRRYFFDWLVDLAYRLAGASRLVLIHSSAPDSLSYRARDN